jgi:DNA-binding FadR family transcriptional regulator
MSVAADAPIGRSLRIAKTSEVIADYLRRRIVRGELAQGEVLPPERELIQQFAVSRPTLREAFRILESEQLIEIRRGARGGKVMTPDIAVAARYVGLMLQISKTTLVDVYEARAVIEPAAAGLLAARRTDRDLVDLTLCVEGLERLLDAGTVSGYASAWVTATQSFHQLILERSRNQTLSIQYSLLREVVAMHTTSAVRRPTEAPRADFRRLTRSYRKLIRLLTEQNVRGVQEHWRLHLETAGRSLLRDEPGTATVLDLYNNWTSGPDQRLS